VIWKEQFGAKLSAEQAAELLTQKKVSQPMLLTVEEAKRYGSISLNADGTVGWKPVPAKTKIKDRALLGLCPRCGSDIIEGEKGFGCSNWKSGCKFVVWKKMANRKIPQEMVRVLLKDGITPFIQKFTNKDGKRFDARLKLENGDVKFDFTQNEKKPEVNDPPVEESA
jgi:DNA topoisomerase-3